MSSDDRSKIQLELIPMIHETVTEWLIIHFLAIMPSESYSAEDFSSQLSSLKIGMFKLILYYCIGSDKLCNSVLWLTVSFDNFQIG